MCAIIGGMQRRKDEPLPLEIAVLRTIAVQGLRKVPAHGYAIRRELNDSGFKVGAGTIYRVLSRLEDALLIRGAWEDEVEAGRPRKRLYELTDKGLVVVGAAPTRAAGARAGAVVPQP
jgi:DNA-binding PadR family transcriptional regulator